MIEVKIRSARNVRKVWIIRKQHLALFHAMLAIRDRPEREKAAFKALFDYYVFGDSNLPHAHLPESGKGVLGSIDEVTARRLRAIIINQLNK